MLAMSFEVQIYVIIGILAVLLGVSLVLIILLNAKLEKTLNRQDFVGKRLKTESIDVLLENCLLKQNEIELQIDNNKEDINELYDLLDKTFDKIDVVRYSSNPEDKNADSFSVGITNAEKTGVIITGLQGETGTKVFVTRVKKGVPDEDITDEELAVIKREE